MDEVLESFEAYVGNDDDPRVGLDRAKWVVLGLYARRCERVEDCALPDVGEADDAASKCHGRRMFPYSRDFAMPESLTQDSRRKPESLGSGSRP